MTRSLPEQWWNQLTLPVISAPMFLISGPELVKECCLNGVIGSFPAPNARPIEVLDQWMSDINDTLIAAKDKEPYQRLLHGQ